jgi:ribonuclease HI
MKVFTDGACSDNGRKGAKASWAAVFPDDPTLDCAGRLEGEQTNNRAEFTAAIKALEVSEGPIHVFTDSQLLIKIVTGQWKAKVNLDLVKKLSELVKEREVTWTHVKAHTGRTDYESQWNAEADSRATKILTHFNAPK